MEATAHHLSFYQAQYQPSFIVDADQQKIDDYLTNCTDTLNTPNIDPDFFNEGNLFCNEKVHLKSIKHDPIVDDYTYINDISLAQSNVNALAAGTTYDRSANYSPQQLESSQIININSPEMMPVSPNKVCPQMDASYAIEDDTTVYNQMAEYEQTLALYASPSNSTCNSRSSSISSGSGDNSHSYEYLLSTVDTLATDNSALLCRVPPSPASITSQYSAESSSKTFTNLDNVTSLAQVQIKQEPVDLDLYQPTVIEEFEQNGSNGMYLPQTMTSSSYSTLNTSELANQYYQYSSVNLPSTVNSVILQQQQVLPPTTQTTPTGGSRKRNAAAAFAAATATGQSSSSGSSTKKPRMTKREKQKMMENDISKFENENRDLRQSIDLLERQIAFCKRFLSENVAPVIQRQQQMGTQFGGSPMMVTVNEM